LVARDNIPEISPGTGVDMPTCGATTALPLISVGAANLEAAPRILEAARSSRVDPGICPARAIEGCRRHPNDACPAPKRARELPTRELRGCAGGAPVAVKATD
jgi:hypothetical protein